MSLEWGSIEELVKRIEWGVVRHRPHEVSRCAEPADHRLEEYVGSLRYMFVNFGAAKRPVASHW